MLGFYAMSWDFLGGRALDLDLDVILGGGAWSWIFVEIIPCRGPP